MMKFYGLNLVMIWLVIDMKSKYLNYPNIYIWIKYLFGFGKFFEVSRLIDLVF